VVVDAPGEHAGSDADALVTATPGCTLAVRTADCAPVVLQGKGSVGLVHAGWRGLVAGVVARAVEVMRGLDDPPARAVLGPCIRAGCYEFSGPDLDVVAGRFGDGVRATTMWGSPALDLAAVVRAACAAAGIAEVDDEGACTACDDRWYSHRARGEPERFVTLAWIEPEGRR
jgi:hypothetical protein